jgi:hypothetical protein
VTLAKEQAARLAYDINYRGKSTAVEIKDKGPGFVNHFPKPPGRTELDRRVASDQAGLWSLNKPTGLHTRVEKVVAKKWGVDSDKEFWSDGKEKDKFFTTFFKGRRYDSDDFAAQDKLIEGDLKREIIAKENAARKKIPGGMFPEEIEAAAKEKTQQEKPQFLLNFPKRTKAQGIGNGQTIKMLDALPEDQLVKTKWKVPEPEDFECEPARPGVGAYKRYQKQRIAHKQREYRDRVLRDKDDAAFGGPRSEEDVSGGEEGDVGLSRASVMSANTSVTMMKSEFSISRGEGLGEL